MAAEQSDGSGARSEYESRRVAWRDRADGEERTDGRLGAARLGLFGLAAGMTLWVMRGQPHAWPALPVLWSVFAVLVIVHGGVKARLGRARRAGIYYDRGLARLSDDWDTGPDGAGAVALDHPYANDLDLFGPGSIFQRMAWFRTRLGGEEFTRWLVPPLDRALNLAAVRGRTADLQALVANQDLREEVALLGEPEQDVDGSALVAWAAGPPIQVSAVWRRLALVVGAGVVPALWAWFAGYGLSPLLVVATLQAVIGQITRSAVRAIESGGSERLGDLTLLAGMTAVGERSSAGLESVAGQLEAAGSRASDRLAGLATRLRWSAEARYHAVLAPLAFLVGGRLHAAHAIEAWRTAHAGRLEIWLAAVGRLDALVGLSAWGFENPECTSAEIVEDEVVLDAKGVGHPLLSDSDCVRNDVQLDAEHPLLLISGSNMSGKSTLLRSVGVNVVLGLAGLPVRAERFVTSPFALGASIQIHDSLRAGRSHFEAELRRLHALDDLSTGDRPLLYLLDEVLAGTNSHDRALGAEAVLTALTARGAVGLVTTHDLALTTLVDRLEPAPRNFHFRDHVSDGKMAFDYRLRVGVVPRGNALALMRVLGFDV